MILSDPHREAIRSTRDSYEAGMAEATQIEREARLAFVASIEAAREAGATNQEIGDVLGVTRQRVSQLLRKDVGK